MSTQRVGVIKFGDTENKHLRMMQDVPRAGDEIIMDGDHCMIEFVRWIEGDDWVTRPTLYLGQPKGGSA